MSVTVRENESIPLCLLADNKQPTAFVRLKDVYTQYRIWHTNYIPLLSYIPESKILRLYSQDSAKSQACGGVRKL